MPEASGILAKYVFLDVVDFSKVRSTAAQLNIISVLNTIVRQAVAAFDIPEGESGNVIYLPTGDGICVGVIDANQLPGGHDVHLRLALRIIEGVQQHNDTPELREEMKFQVRIGINDHSDDKRITDINNRPNLAGAGINMAQRIMSFAEGNQIFVGSNTYDVLKNYSTYMVQGMFRHYDLTVKHADAPGRVFQYIGEAGSHRGLNIMPPEASLMKEEAITLYKSASHCGMKKIYHSRAEVADSVLHDIKGARRRVWISAVGLAEKVKLSEILTSIDKNPLGSRLNVQFLLLDALRSTALFRTFLEISRRAFRDIITPDRTRKRPTEEPYFLQTLYNTFHSGYVELRRRNAPNFAARFYGHTPMCWLVIIDDTAYFQPYTFGKSKRHGFDNLTIGPLMPVFKFQLQDHANTETFNILEDHFKKLWLTSDVDLFHLGARLAQSHEIIESIFTKRRGWFSYVYNALHEDDEKVAAEDRRWRTRRHCKSDVQPQTKVFWTPPGGEQQQVEAKIINFSHDGILLKPKSESFPPVDTIATLKVTTVRSHPPTEHLMNELLNPSKNQFRVVWVKDGLVGLTSRLKKDAPAAGQGLVESHA
jgi:class 3 adenylate cyclase